MISEVRCDRKRRMQQRWWFRSARWVPHESYTGSGVYHFVALDVVFTFFFTRGSVCDSPYHFFWPFSVTDKCIFGEKRMHVHRQLRFSSEFSKVCKRFEILGLGKNVEFVDLGKRFPTSIWSSKSVLIQPRTIPLSLRPKIGWPGDEQSSSGDE